MRLCIQMYSPCTKTFCKIVTALFNHDTPIGLRRVCFLYVTLLSIMYPAYSLAQMDWSFQAFPFASLTCPSSANSDIWE